MNWTRIFNRLFDLINVDRNHPAYFSGRRFIDKVREIDQYHPDYYQYIELRRDEDKSTSRRDFFYDIILNFELEDRIRFIRSILNDIEEHFPEEVAEIRGLLVGEVIAPIAEVDEDLWNADRLNDYLVEIDNSLTGGNYERAVTLSYTCLEGFYKAFVRRNIPNKADENEIIRLSRIIKDYLRANVENYSDESLSIITNISHTVDRTRNQFSEAHFDNEASMWLAKFVRDLVNSQIRLLLHFI